MNRIRIYKALSFLLLLPFAAGAQEPQSPAAVRFNLNHTLWFASRNAAGLSATPLDPYSTVGFSYAYQTGAYHRMQTGETVSDLEFDTQGALAIGKIQLWGHFSYNNLTDRGTRFNTVLYDPYDERQVFSVADPNLSDWKRQCYAMEFKAARPFGKSLSAGLHLRYTDRIAAKQVDPRSESYKYDIELLPGLLWHRGRSAFGLSGYYANMMERSVPVLSNVSEIQDVFVLRGLGNYVRDIVGSGGLSTLYYHSNTYGGALQYQYSGKKRLFAEAGAHFSATSTRESATQPFNMGSTAKSDFFASFRMLGEKSLLTARFHYDLTKATEYTSVWNISTGEWEVRTQMVGSAYSGTQADLRYERYAGHLESLPYKWRFAAEAAYAGKRDIYYLPQSDFSYDNAALKAEAERLFRVGKTVLDASLSAGYQLNLSGGYHYGGSQASGAPASEWYPHDIAVMTADCLTGALSAGLSYPLSGRLAGSSLTAGISAGGILAGNGMSRLQAQLRLGLVFGSSSRK